MSNYTLNPNFIHLSNEKILDVIKNELRKTDTIKSISGIIYSITSVNYNSIEFTGKDRNKGLPEEIDYENIEAALIILKSLKVFNTNNTILKRNIPNKIYKKRSPIFAILLSAKVIIKI